MNFEKIINYFRRLGQAIRTRFAGFRSKRGDKSFNERKSTTDSKWNRKQVRKSTEDRMTLLDMGDVFLKTLKLLSDFFYREYLRINPHQSFTANIIIPAVQNAVITIAPWLFLPRNHNLISLPSHFYRLAYAI